MGLALAAYLAILLGWNYTLLFELTETSIGQPLADKQMHYWDLWWSFKGLTESGRSFFHSDFIYSPPGVSLWRSNAGFLLFLTAMLPMAAVPDLDLAYNFIALFCLFISCVGGYLLGWRLFKDTGIAFYLGLVTAFNPFVLFHMDLGLFEVTNLGWAMIYISALERLVDRKDFRSTLMAALWYIIATAWCWYVGYLLVLFTGAFFVVRLDLRALFSTGRGFIPRLALFGAVVGTFLLIISSQMGLDQMAGNIQDVEERVAQEVAGGRSKLTRNADGVLKKAAARAGLANEAAVESLELKICTSLDLPATLGPSTESDGMATLSPALWLMPMILALLAVVWRRDRVVLLYGLLGVTGVALSLGPCIVINAVVQWGTCGLTPYGLLARVVPGLSRIHFPHRLLLLTVLAVAILSAYGLAILLRQFGQARWPRWIVISFVSILSLAGGPCIVGFPFHEGKMAVPATYGWLAGQKGDFGIIEVPSKPGAGLRDFYPPSRLAYYQTVHGKRRMYGSIPGHLVPSQRPPAVKDNLLLRQITKFLHTPPATDDPSGWDHDGLRKAAEDLNRLGYRYILLHSEFMSDPGFDPMFRLLTETLGQAEEDLKLQEDPVMVFALPGSWRAHTKTQGGGALGV